MDCRDYSENLQAYVDDELSEPERLALEAHLSECESCTGELRALMKVNSLLDKAFKGKPSTSSFMARVIARITGSTPAEQAAKAQRPKEDEEDPGTSLAGQTLAGYEVLEKIGSGGMGTVYRATQLSMGRDVALKVLYHKFSQDETFVKRFIREARSAGGLNHPNIVRVYDVGHERGFYFMSMELVRGRSAHQLLCAERRIEPERALDIAIQTARALEHAQKNSIIHRDVKPENIILDEEGPVKLADLGLAKKIGASSDAGVTMEGQVMGTPQYMSPEQVVDSSSVDHRTDIYSLGATFYFLVTGEKPFEGKSAMEAMVAVIHEEIKFSREHLTYVPKQIVRVIEKMTAKDRDKRHQTATELIKELEHIRSRPLTLHTPAAAPKPRAVRTATARRDREPSSVIEKKASNYMWLVAVAAGLLLVIGLWVAISSSTPEKPPIIVTPDPVPDPVPPPLPPITPVEVAKTPEPAFEGEAKKEWDALVKLIAEHPDEYAEQLSRLEGIFKGYPSSKYEENARTLHGEITKKLDKAFAKAREESDKLRRVNDYNGAIALWYDFEEKYAGTEVAETGASFRKPLITQQRSKFRRDIKVADSKFKSRDADGAIYLLEKIAEYGTDDMKKQAVAKIKSYEGQLAAAAERKKYEEQLVLLDEFYRRTAEHFMDGQYPKVVEAIELAAGNPHFAQIKEYVNLERADVLHLMDLKKTLYQAFKKMTTATLDVYVNLRSADKAVIGTVKEMSPDVFVLKPRDKKYGSLITLRMKRLTPAEVVRLTKNLLKDPADASVKYHLFYLYEADFAKSLAYLDKVSGRKRAVAQEKQASTPKPEPEKKTPEEEMLSEAEKKLRELMEKYRKDKEKPEKKPGKLVEKRPGTRPKPGEVVEKIIDPGDPQYTICYRKFDKVKPVLEEILLERTAKKLYDSAKIAYRKKDYEDAQEVLERLLSGEFAKAKFLSKAKRDEIARLLGNIEKKSGHTLAEKDKEKDLIARLFNAAKVEKLRSGKYRVTYDFTKSEQLKDFLIGRDLLKDDRIKQLFSWRSKKGFKYGEAPPWAVVKYGKHSMVNGKEGHTFTWKGLIDGDVTLEFSAIPLQRQNVIGLLCVNKDGAYVVAASYRAGDADWHRRTFGLTRSVAFRRYWEGEDRTRLLNGGWEVIGNAGKMLVNLNTAYTVKAVRKENKITFSVNGQRYVEGRDNTWTKGRVGVWARESHVLYTNIKITGELDKEWVEKETKRLGLDKKKKEDKIKKPEVVKKGNPYEGASDSVKGLLDAAKKIKGVTNEDLMRLKKIAETAENFGGRRGTGWINRELARVRSAEELRRKMDQWEEWGRNAPDPGRRFGPGRGPGRGGGPGGGR